MRRGTSLTFKLLTIIAFATIVFVFMSTVSYRAINRANTNIEFLGQQRIGIMEALGTIHSTSHAGPKYLLRAFNHLPHSPEREAALKSYNDTVEVLKLSVDDLSNYQLNEEFKSKISAMRDTLKSLDNLNTNLKKNFKDRLSNDPVLREYLTSSFLPIEMTTLNIAKQLSEIGHQQDNYFIREFRLEGQQNQKILTLVGAISSFFLMILGTAFILQISKRLVLITSTVGSVSTQVSQASGQLARGSEQLSNSAQKQASSLEETSASITEIAGMVEANVRGAEHAHDSAREIKVLSEDTQKSMLDLSMAMDAILESNVRISKLTKVIEEIAEKTDVIDDIVFKTQLLSFNASVEAERAGEHGRGFGVVAQEVGNLAQMSGKAAAEIGAIVKQSIRDATDVSQDNRSRVERGNVLALESQRKVGQVLDRVNQILEETRKIVAASKEQSQGINQITTSVDFINKSTQETASTSQETSGASVELAAQSESLLNQVNELQKIVLGATKDRTKDVPLKQEMAVNFQHRDIKSSNFTHAEKEVRFAKSEPRGFSKNYPSTGDKPNSSNQEPNADDGWEKL